MAETAIAYVYQTPTGGWRIAGSRVSLDSIVHAYRSGRGAEAIQDSFPSLTLEQIHGAIAFYLHNRGEIDRYLAAQEGKWEQVRDQSEAANAELLERLRAARPRRPYPEHEGVCRGSRG
jgi:uncharacterized protein (DUF433 family)